jgi:hypothetical protein
LLFAQAIDCEFVVVEQWKKLKMETLKAENRNEWRVAGEW